jgi:biopolymer transport protein ExbB/TolQ
MMASANSGGMFLASEGGLAEALAQIASALRTPVLVLALLALLACALEAGRFAMEAYSRARAGRGRLRQLAAQVIAEPSRAGAVALLAPSSFAAGALMQIAGALVERRPDAVEHALADYELAVQRRLDRTRILVRAGPALGLMGTLIPLAPGLAALGHGDVSRLATDLRTAFAATTIGLLVGTVAFALTLMRTRVYSEDLTVLERATSRIGAMAATTESDRPTPPVALEHAAEQTAPGGATASLHRST